MVYFSTHSHDWDFLVPSLWVSDLPSAKWICGRCQVKTDCLSEALASNEATGIWGGLNEVERRALSLDGTSSNFGLEESSVVN